MQSECGKMRTRITPNTDTFYSVYICTIHSSTRCICYKRGMVRQQADGGHNNLTRKELERMTKNQLIKSAMKLQNNMLTEQTELINDDKEFREKLEKNFVDSFK